MGDLKYVKKSLFDYSSVTEKYTKTDIKFYIPGTDECVFTLHNKIILPGAAFTARGHFDLPRTEITPSYNTALALDNSLYTTPTSLERTYLFCVGTDGCGRENSQVYEESYSKWIMPESLIPFRYQLKAKDLSDSLRQVYFGRKTLTDYYAYYFKSFDSGPTLVQQYIDGTAIDNTVYTNSNTLDVETYVELKLRITEDDCRDYFIKTTGINDARINTLSLLTAWYTTDINGVKWYHDVRPLTKLNIPNEPLIDLLKGIDIKYQIYY